ncbi:hypothetical protein HYPSUDRAFT_49434 [Hypholoma sublateritium FD-334 SS-4]|uniref:Uncharacterized protein n=1 Tax=Hypholoma sublateritium (strain FD-334 SS-4) TaxID=945553 RepID=A0A0D2LTK8_HYPSF|nr:hypothetical protein HYPSUDRAFT_49434 [Hypholoma sublateritium FD-334 SS-4]
MAKNAKKPPVHNGKPITAFFAPRSSVGSSPQGASRSSGKQASRMTSSPVALGNAIQPVSNPGLSALKSAQKSSISAIVDSLKVSPNSPRRSERNQSSSGPLMPPVAVAPLKRLRSPSLLAATAMPEPVASGNCEVSVERRKSKYDSDSEMEKMQNAIYVSSTPNPKSKKRPRLLAVEDPKISELSDMIPSSQSDEQELSFENAADVPKLVVDVDNVSRNTSWSITPERNMDNNTMEVDRDLSELSPITTPPTDSWLSTPQGSQSSDPGTPPPSGLSSIPPTPVVLDCASKTAQIIAEIKAKAYATVTSSPEPVTLELDDHSDLSSDDEEATFPLLLPSKTVPSTLRLDVPTNDFGTIQQAGRYSLRKRSPSPSHESRFRIAQGRAATKVAPQKIATRKPSGRKPLDPFAALLKEKRSSQRHGNGDAFTRAELHNQNMGKNGPIEEMGEDEDDTLDSQSEDIAKAVVENPEAFTDEFEKIQIPTGRKSKEIMDGVEDEGRKTLFGAKNGGFILDILKQDKAMKQHDESSEKTSGTHFWSLSSSNMSLATKDVSTFCLFGPSVLIRLFNACLRRTDLSRAATLLNSNFISSLEISDRASVTSDLYNLAFSFPPTPDLLRNAAVNALEEFWNSNEEPRTSTISFPRILNTVQALGADASIIAVHNWVNFDVQQYIGITVSSRESFLFQLIVLITSCARSKRLQVDDISDIVVILLLVGMDKSISTNLARDINLAIDGVCHNNLQTESNNSEIEIHLCSRISQFAQAYDPINKSRLVLLLSGGSSAMRRIANIVAYCIITNKQSLEREIYSDTPPLPEVIDQLIPYSRLSALPPGKFALHPETDYVDLGFYITILGVAVSNLRNYAVLESKALAARHSTALTVGSPRKVIEKLKPDLQLLHAGLETLHSNILDTRATHLERSRTKAAIKGLAMNIYYQREHWVKNGPDARSKTLAEYFQKKLKP